MAGITMASRFRSKDDGEPPSFEELFPEATPREYYEPALKMAKELGDPVP